MPPATTRPATVASLILTQLPGAFALDLTCRRVHYYRQVLFGNGCLRVNLHFLDVVAKRTAEDLLANMERQVGITLFAGKGASL